MQSRSGSVRDPQFQAGVRDVVHRLRATGSAVGIRSPYSKNAADLVSKDGRSALVTLNVENSASDVNMDHPEKVDPISRAVGAAQRAHPGLRIEEYGDYKWSRLAPAMWSTLVVEITTQDDGLDALGDVVPPTLVVVGEQDESFIGPSYAMADVIPDSRLVVIPDAGHSPQFENPSVWLAAVTGFLDELD